jgi:hypothetical protein
MYALRLRESALEVIEPRNGNRRSAGTQAPRTPGALMERSRGTADEKQGRIRITQSRAFRTTRRSVYFIAESPRAGATDDELHCRT